MADGFLILFDITDKLNLNAVKDWIEDIKSYNSSNIFLILANKDYLDNKISDDVINETLGDYNHLLLNSLIFIYIILNIYDFKIFFLLNENKYIIKKL